MFGIAGSITAETPSYEKRELAKKLLVPRDIDPHAVTHVECSSGCAAVTQ